MTTEPTTVDAHTVPLGDGATYGDLLHSAALLKAQADRIKAEADVVKSLLANVRENISNRIRTMATEDGTAPTLRSDYGTAVWNIPKPVAHVEEPEAFAAAMPPVEVTVSLRIDSDQLQAALMALDFAGVPVQETRSQVRPAYERAVLKGLRRTKDGRTVDRDDKAVPGVTWVTPDPYLSLKLTPTEGDDIPA